MNTSNVDARQDVTDILLYKQMTADLGSLQLTLHCILVQMQQRAVPPRQSGHAAQDSSAADDTVSDAPSRKPLSTGSKRTYQDMDAVSASIVIFLSVLLPENIRSSVWHACLVSMLVVDVHIFSLAGNVVFCLIGVGNVRFAVVFRVSGCHALTFHTDLLQSLCSHSRSQSRTTSFADALVGLITVNLQPD